MSKSKNTKANDAFGFGGDSDEEMEDVVETEQNDEKLIRLADQADDEESAFGFNFASAPDKKVFDPSKSAKRTPGEVGKAKPSSK